MFFRKTLLIIFITAVTLLSQNRTYDFLRMDYSPKAAALAGSFVANADDPNVIFYNPAGLNDLNDTPVSFSYFKHLLDINSASVATSYYYEGIGRIGAGILYTNYGEFDGKDSYGNDLGTFSANEFALLLSYSNVLAENFNYGITAKIIYSGIEDYSSSAVALDFGFNYKIESQNIIIGLAVLNAGTQLSSYIDSDEDLPLDIRIGISKEMERMPFRFYASLNRLADSYDSDGDRFKQFTVGAEIRLGSALKARVGYDNEKRQDFKIGSSAGLGGISLGLGLNIKEYIVDYAYSSLGDIGSYHRFGITTSF